jgi:hypothetical protein
MLRLERVQPRGIGTALGLMCLTLNNSLAVLSGIAPLAGRFVYLNFRYFVAVFYRLDHPIKRRPLGSWIWVAVLRVIPMFCHYIVASESFAGAPGYSFCGWSYGEALSGVRTSVYSVVAPRELLTVTAKYAASMVFYTDGFLRDGCAGFAFHREGSFGYRISSPAGICNAYYFVCDTAKYWWGYSTPGKVLDFDSQLEFS